MGQACGCSQTWCLNTIQDQTLNSKKVSDPRKPSSLNQALDQVIANTTSKFLMGRLLTFSTTNSWKTADCIQIKLKHQDSRAGRNKLITTKLLGTSLSSHYLMLLKKMNTFKMTLVLVQHRQLSWRYQWTASYQNWKRMNTNTLSLTFLVSGNQQSCAKRHCNTRETSTRILAHLVSPITLVPRVTCLLTNFRDGTIRGRIVLYAVVGILNRTLCQNKTISLPHICLQMNP